MNLFKYVDDKDVFQQFYSRQLAKRLIYGFSVSIDAEANMISRMKASCGYEYTSKLQRMITDLSLSSDLNQKFTESQPREKSSKSLQFSSLSDALLDRVEFSVMVLTAGSWPLSSHPIGLEFLVPSEVRTRCHVVNLNTTSDRILGGRLSDVLPIATQRSKTYVDESPGTQ